LGIGDWAQSPIPNPQSPIPNPHFSYQKYKNNKSLINLTFTKIKTNNYLNFKICQIEISQ
jgi:hypothetical protein